MSEPREPDGITFSATVVEWADEGRRITVEVGPDCREYPRVGATVKVTHAIRKDDVSPTEAGRDTREVKG